MMRTLGRLLRGWRPGPDTRVAEDHRFAFAPRTIDLRSPVFADGAELSGEHASPPLAWSGIPPGTKTLALVIEDIDVPLPRPFVHAVAYAIDPAKTTLAAGELDDAQLPLGLNSARGTTYRPPRPLPGHGPHRYVFTLLAVDFVPHFDQPPSRGRLLDAIAGHVLALGELTGTHERF
jgi:Raf kinase inhibitor-like YbhB/YbcL family protein